KNYPAEVALKANVKETLRALLPVIRALRTPERAVQAARRLADLEKQNWTAKRQRLAHEVQSAAITKPMDPRLVMMRIAETLPGAAVVVDEGVTARYSLPSFLPLRDAHCYYGLASGGIGFAMSGAIGISLALPQRPVVAIVGDGSAMYSAQALWTAANLERP